MDLEKDPGELVMGNSTKLEIWVEKYLGPTSFVRKYHTAFLAALVSLFNSFWFYSHPAIFESSPSYKYFHIFWGPVGWALVGLISPLSILLGAHYKLLVLHRLGLLAHFFFWTCMAIFYYAANPDSTATVASVFIALWGADGYIETLWGRLHNTCYMCRLIQKAIDIEKRLEEYNGP